MEPWQPTATFEFLRARARLLAAARCYFADRGVLEIETPAFVRSGVTDVHIDSVRAKAAGLGLEGYLITSPEYSMKRMLAAGSGDIYQICHVFRDGERGRWHNPEFTLIEWYRVGFDSDRMMGDVESLLGALLGPLRPWQPAVRLTYREAMRRFAGLDPFEESIGAIERRLEQRGVELPPGLGEQRDSWLDLVMSTLVGPELGRPGLAFVHDFPASQASLARLRPGEPRVAERFEAFLDGVELANGFRELADATEQRARFVADQDARRRAGRDVPPVDERLLAALAAGLPDCAGVALGFDRVAMLACGASSIDDVIAFAGERA